MIGHMLRPKQRLQCSNDLGTRGEEKKGKTKDYLEKHKKVKEKKQGGSHGPKLEQQQLTMRSGNALSRLYVPLGNR